MWTGTFAEVLQTGPKVEKRKERDDDNDVDDKKSKRQELDSAMKNLARVDSRLMNYFNFVSNADVDALSSLEKYRYDALVQFRSEVEPFESVTHFLYANSQKALFAELTKPFGLPLPEITPAQMTEAYRRRSPQYAFRRPDGSYSPGNTDFETFFALLMRPSMEIIAANGAAEPISFIVGVLALVLARFEATDAIKLILKKISKQDAVSGPFDDLIRPQLLADLFVELSKQQRAFTVEAHMSGIADLVKIRILSYLEKADFIQYCKTEKTIKEKCESGIWKNQIAELRFERQFGKESDEVLQLRYRFYDSTVTKRTFMYAAIRAAKFLNKEYTNQQFDIARLMRYFTPPIPFDDADEDRALELPVFMWLLGRLNAPYAKQIFEIFLRRLSLSGDSLVDSEGLIYDGSDFFETVQSVENWLFFLLDGYSLQTVKKIYKKHKQDPVWADAAINLDTEDMLSRDAYLYLFNALLKNESISVEKRQQIASEMIDNSTALLRSDHVEATYLRFKNKSVWNEIVRRKLNVVENAWSEEFELLSLILLLHCDRELEEDIRERALFKVVSGFVYENDGIFMHNADKYYKYCDRSDIWLRIVREIATTNKVEDDVYRYRMIEISLKIVAKNDAVEGKEFLLNNMLERYILHPSNKENRRYAVYTLDDWVEIYPNAKFWLPIFRKLYDLRPFRVLAYALVKLDEKTTVPADVRLFFARVIVKDKDNYVGPQNLNWARSVLGLEPQQQPK